MTNDGGPAYPSMDYMLLASGRKQLDLEDDLLGKNVQVTHYKKESGGMSLRDWFAGQALHGTLAATAGEAQMESFRGGVIDSGRSAAEHLAWTAYDIADAMLAARKEQPQ